MSPTRVPLIYGTMTMGEAGQNTIRTSTLPDCQAILDVFFKHGHTELDTARVYGGGTTEEFLGQLDLKNAVIDTKCDFTNHTMSLYRAVENRVNPGQPDGHKPFAVRKALMTSLKALKRDKVRIFYLHGPYRKVPYEETCEEINKLHKEGYFEIFGLSNFMAWEVAEIVQVCKERGWVQPKVYQAMYNGIMRALEPELLPCLKKYGIRLVVYNPLAGGFLTGKILSPDTPLPAGRFAGENPSAVNYRKRYLKDGYFAAIQHIKAVADKHGLTITEVALRWCQHHSSALGPGDGVIIGASSPAQLEENCIASAKGPLPQEVVDAMDEAWVKVGDQAPNYFW